MFPVRPATPNDSDAISSLFVFLDAVHANARSDIFRRVAGNPRPPELLVGLLGKDDSLVLVVDGPHEPIGLAIACLRTVDAQSVLAARRYVLLDALVTHPEHRHRGVGRSLIRSVEHWARACGANSVEVGVHEFNRDAKNFYQRLGYETQTRRLEKRLEKME
jgi:GNAT superfamily N-acetyltransferase